MTRAEGQLPEGWAWSKLSDLAATEHRAITDGPFGSNLKSAHYTESGPRVIRLQNIGDGVFRDEEAHISEEHFAGLQRHSVQGGDLVVASLGETLPRACIVPPWVPPAIVKADCIRVRLHPGVSTKYVNFALQRADLRDETATKIKGVGRPRLGMAGIKDLPVPLPPLAEQQRIVTAIEELLSRLDAAEASLAIARDRCGAASRAVILSALPRSLPEGWKVTTVAEAGRTSLGRQRSPRFHHGSNMKPYLRVANVFEDRIDTGDVMEMHFEPAEFDRYRLQMGDVLLNEGQSPQFLGRPAIYRGEPPEAAFTNSLIRFVPGEQTTPEWALLVFRHHMHSRRFMQESKITTNIAHLALGRFRTVEFPLPPLEVQRELVERVRASLDAIARQKFEIERAQAHGKALRRSILAAAFSGRLVAQDPSDEPADVLLARIAEERSSAGTKRRATARSSTKVKESSS